jgi:hypothetical protein
MPIVIKSEDVARLGGQYRPDVLPPKKAPALTPKTAEPVVVEQQPTALIESLDRVVSSLTKHQSAQGAQLEKIAAIMAKSGGTWTVTVKSRDQHGRVLSLDFEQHAQG